MAWSNGMDGRGSRDPYTQTWQDYGQGALSEYLLNSYRDNYLNTGAYNTAAADPLGIIQDPSRLSAFFNPIRERDDWLAIRDPNLNWGVETEPSRTFTPTRDEVQRFIDRQYADFMAAGNANNDAMWLPRMEGDNVVTGVRNSGGGGILDAITGAVEPAIALSGFAGPALGSGIAAGALAESGAALADIALGGAGGSAGAAGLGGATTALGGAAGGGVLSGITDAINSIPNPFSTTGTGTTGGALTADQVAAEVAGLTGSGTSTGGAIGTGAVAGGVGAGTGALSDIIEETGNITTGTGSGTGTTTGTTGTGASAGLLDRILNGTATAADWASVLGTVGSTALGVYGANQQGDALRDIANQARNDRLPFLNQATNWFNNPASYYSGAPAQEAMKGTLAGLSAQFGNPIGSGTALALANEAGLRNWQNAWTGAANIGLGGQDSRNNILTQAAQSDSGVYDAIGYGMENIFNPRNNSRNSLSQSWYDYMVNPNFKLP